MFGNTFGESGRGSALVTMNHSDDGPWTRRRTVLTAVGGVTLAALAGCSSGDGDDDGGGDGSTVAVGPGGDLTYEPAELTVSTGETVTWEFESASHNVSAWPDMHDRVSIPEAASGFGTMPQDGDKFATVDEGETFEYTFETPGEYTYVCVPHAAADMVGTVVVE
jgi:plastocyanin